MKPKVFVTYGLFAPARALLEKHFEVDYWLSQPRPLRDELLRRVAGKDALICLLTEKINDKDVILTPHIASASVETRTKMALIAVENVIALFDGRRPPNALNPEVLAAK